MNPICGLCGKPITPDQASYYHQRLAIQFHASHPLTEVEGEDVTGHTLTWIPPRPPDPTFDNPITIGGVPAEDRHQED